jgi:peptide-methionine (S)-S-oxide reductase
MMKRLLATLLLAAGLMVGPSGAQDTAPPPLAKATFAGGCFWCMEPPFDELAGVVSTTSGYTGGQQDHPTYEQVSAGGTGHAEAVEILYDPAKISYERLIEVFWHNIDPLDASGQFCDRGDQYRTAIFTHDAARFQAAQASKRALEDSQRLGKLIQTEIVSASTFFPAEDYHQDFYQKHPLKYKFYRYSCGRDSRLRELWGRDALG